MSILAELPKKTRSRILKAVTRSDLKWISKRVTAFFDVKEASGSPLGNLANNVAVVSQNRAKNFLVQKRVRELQLAYPRIHNCGKPLLKEVALKKNVETGKFSFSGIERCGSVHSCRPCRQKIVKKRSEEMTIIKKELLSRDIKYSTMLTLTVPHYNHDLLGDLLGKSSDKTGLLGALYRMRQSSSFRNLKSSIGYFADARSVESTWGIKNGWHPHFHILIYHTKKWTNEQTKQIKDLWDNSCLKSGLRKPGQIVGVNVTDFSEKKHDYLIKFGSGELLFSSDKNGWNGEKEINGSIYKSGKNGNYSINELENCLLMNEKELLKKTGLKIAKIATLLYEYYQTMKNKRLLTWGGSRGWKKDLFNELEDDEVVYQDENSEIVQMIPRKLYMRFWSQGKSFLILEMAEKDIIEMNHILENGKK